ACGCHFRGGCRLERTLSPCRNRLLSGELALALPDHHRTLSHSKRLFFFGRKFFSTQYASASRSIRPKAAPGPPVSAIKSSALSGKTGFFQRRIFARSTLFPVNMA